MSSPWVSSWPKPPRVTPLLCLAHASLLLNAQNFKDPLWRIALTTLSFQLHLPNVILYMMLPQLFSLLMDKGSGNAAVFLCLLDNLPYRMPLDITQRWVIQSRAGLSPRVKTMMPILSYTQNQHPLVTSRSVSIKTNTWMTEVIPKLICPYMYLLWETQNLRLDPSPPTRECTCMRQPLNLSVLIVRFHHQSYLIYQSID